MKFVEKRIKPFQLLCFFLNYLKEHFPIDDLYEYYINHQQPRGLDWLFFTIQNSEIPFLHEEGPLGSSWFVWIKNITPKTFNREEIVPIKQKTFYIKGKCRECSKVQTYAILEGEYWNMVSYSIARGEYYWLLGKCADCGIQMRYELEENYRA